MGRLVGLSQKDVTTSYARFARDLWFGFVLWRTASAGLWRAPRAPQPQAMFLWWSKKKEEVETPEEIAEKQAEIDELRQELSSATLQRSSNVSKGKFSKWAVAEDKRAIGNAVRAEMDAASTQRDEIRNEFLEQGHERITGLRQQREAAAQRVRDHRAAMQARGQQQKSHEADNAATARTRREAYLQHAVKLAQIHGAEPNRWAHLRPWPCGG